MEVVVRSTSDQDIQVLVSVPPYKNICPWECWMWEWWMYEPFYHEMRVGVANWEVWVDGDRNSLVCDIWAGGRLNEGEM